MKCSSTCSNCEPDNDDYITALNDVEVHITPELEEIAHELPETTELSSTSNTTTSSNIKRKSTYSTSDHSRDVFNHIFF